MFVVILSAVRLFVPEVPLVNIVVRLFVCLYVMSLLSIQAVSEKVMHQQVFLWVL